jgi:hypothetical protein
VYVDASLSDLRVLLTSLLTARIVWPTRPPTHRGRKRTWRPDQRDQLGETEEGRRIDTPIERHKPICKCWMAFGYHLRRRAFRLRHAEDPHIARNRRRHCEYIARKPESEYDVNNCQLWASMYEIYDRLSPAMAAFLETLTAVHDAKFFHEEAARLGNPLRTIPRGSPLNQGSALEAVHPVIRTNREIQSLRNQSPEILTTNSCDRMEERLRQQRFHTPNPRRDQG